MDKNSDTLVKNKINPHQVIKAERTLLAEENRYFQAQLIEKIKRDTKEQAASIRVLPY